MPKAKWGTGDEALTAADIDSAENNGMIYTGDLPPASIYRFVVQSLKKGTSSADNPKLTVFVKLDGTWKPEHAKYEGAPLWDHMPVMKSTAWRVRAFCDSVGATGTDFYDKMVLDENGKVTKLGDVGDPEGLLVYINVSQRPPANGYAASLGINGAGYLPVDADPDGDENQDAVEAAADGDVPDDEPPF